MRGSGSGGRGRGGACGRRRGRGPVGKVERPAGTQPDAVADGRVLPVAGNGVGWVDVPPGRVVQQVVAVQPDPVVAERGEPPPDAGRSCLGADRPRRGGRRLPDQMVAGLGQPAIHVRGAPCRSHRPACNSESYRCFSTCPTGRRHSRGKRPATTGRRRLSSGAAGCHRSPLAVTGRRLSPGAAGCHRAPPATIGRRQLPGCAEAVALSGSSGRCRSRRSSGRRGAACGTVAEPAPLPPGRAAAE